MITQEYVRDYKIGMMLLENEPVNTRIKFKNGLFKIKRPGEKWKKIILEEINYENGKKQDIFQKRL